MLVQQLSLQLLGSPRIECEGAPLKTETRKATALLIYLAVTNENHLRDSLAAMFWPESDQDHASGALRRTLSALRKTPLKNWLETDRESVTFLSGEGCSLDVESFQSRLAECLRHGHPEGEVCPACLTPLIEAVNLYRDDFLSGFSLGTCPAFDDWQFFQAESLRRDVTGALERLVQYLTAQSQFESAIAYARRWLAFDPLHEPAHRQLMRLYAWTGERAAALRQYQECVRVLKQELDVPPLEETTQLYLYLQEHPTGRIETHPQRIVSEPERVAVPAQPPSKGPPTTDRTEEPRTSLPGARLHNFPHPSTPFVGREEELVQIAQLLRNPDCRLLTLLGQGGIGKTRLGLQVASGINGSFQDGTYFIPLSSLSTPDLLVYSIAEVLKFTFFSSRDPRIELLDYLREKQMLLLLDNFEHLLQAADFLKDVLETAPKVKILVTSRERVNLQGEWIFELKGLDVPNGERSHKPEGYSAVQLFMQSVRRIGTAALPKSDQPFIIHICRLVDGIPLGIELAAAWVRVLSCEEIAQEIEHNLDFLIASSRDVAERHQSLRAVFEHSWSLLSLEQQRVFRRISVFQGGFTKEAAQRVAGASLAVLSALVDKSLLYPIQTSRYELHAVLRQYLDEKLDEVPDEKEQTLDRHCQFYADFLLHRADHLRRGKQEEAAAVIAQEIENVRRGWRWATERQKEAEINKYIDCLFVFYEMRSWFKEGEEVFALGQESLRARSQYTTGISPGESLTYAKALLRQGAMCYRLGQYNKARTLLEQSLLIARRKEAKGEIALCLIYLGDIARLMGEFAKAKLLVSESVTLCQETGELRKLGRALNMLGIVAGCTGEYSEAKVLFQESLSTYRKVGDLWWSCKVRENLGSIANLHGDYTEAKLLYQECLATLRKIDDRFGSASCLLNLGIIAYELHEYSQAIELQQESLRLFREAGSLWHMGLCLNDLAKSELALGDHLMAKRHFHAAFKSAVEIGAIPICLGVLVGMADLLIIRGKPHQALEYLITAVSHPAIEHDIRARAERLLIALEKTIPRSAISSARERAKNRYLKKLIVLAEEILKSEEEGHLPDETAKSTESI